MRGKGRIMCSYLFTPHEAMLILRSFQLLADNAGKFETKMESSSFQEAY